MHVPLRAPHPGRGRAGPRRRASRLVALLLAPVLLLPGCSAGEGADGRPTAGELVDVVREAVDEARRRVEQAAGETTPRPVPEDSVLRTDTRTAFDYAEYSSTLAFVLGSLEEYWSQVLPQLGARYSDPARYVYYRPDEATGPSCGGEPAPPRNAFYCPVGDFIAWDETNLMIPYYVQGDFAAAFVLAHEFGHAMQVRLPRQQRLGVLRELQADCYAGAWARYASDEGYVEPGDLDEATLAVFSARDLPGTEFTDPRAHGTGFERTRAFTTGFDGGPAACYPAPAQDWLVGRTSA